MANSKIYLGNTNIGSLFKGASDISIYLGENKVYPLETPLKFQATYSGGETYELECNGGSSLTMGEVSSSSQELSAMTSAIIGDCVTTLSSSFVNCTSLSSVTIPDSVTVFSGQCFGYCSNIRQIDIPSGVTSIGEYCFAQSGIESITLPSAVTYISMYAFMMCQNLTEIIIKATTPPELGMYALFGVSCPIYVPAESVETYKTASDWSEYADKIQAIPTN